MLLLCVSPFSCFACLLGGEGRRWTSEIAHRGRVPKQHTLSNLGPWTQQRWVIRFRTTTNPFRRSTWRGRWGRGTDKHGLAQTPIHPSPSHRGEGIKKAGSRLGWGAELRAEQEGLDGTISVRSRANVCPSVFRQGMPVLDGNPARTFSAALLPVPSRIIGQSSSS